MGTVHHKVQFEVMFGIADGIGCVAPCLISPLFEDTRSPHVELHVTKPNPAAHLKRSDRVVMGTPLRRQNDNLGARKKGEK